jgi:hypothetical protein
MAGRRDRPRHCLARGHRAYQERTKYRQVFRFLPCLTSLESTAGWMDTRVKVALEPTELRAYILF